MLNCSLLQSLQIHPFLFLDRSEKTHRRSTDLWRGKGQYFPKPPTHLSRRCSLFQGGYGKSKVKKVKDWAVKPFASTKSQSIILNCTGIAQGRRACAKSRAALEQWGASPGQGHRDSPFVFLGLRLLCSRHGAEDATRFKLGPHSLETEGWVRVRLHPNPKPLPGTVHPPDNPPHPVPSSRPPFPHPELPLHQLLLASANVTSADARARISASDTEPTQARSIDPRAYLGLRPQFHCMCSLPGKEPHLEPMGFPSPGLHLSLCHDPSPDGAVYSFTPKNTTWCELRK